MKEELTPSPAWLGACCKSFYPEASTVALQAWGKEVCDKGRGWDGAPEEAGMDRAQRVSGSPPTPCTPYSFLGSGHNTVYLCVELCGCDILCVCLPRSRVSVWAHGCVHLRVCAPVVST